jgi:hypothetical protein
MNIEKIEKTETQQKMLQSLSIALKCLKTKKMPQIKNASKPF